MRNYSYILQKLVLLLGNRIGFVFVIGITVALLLVESTEPAISSSEISRTIEPAPAIEGLTFDPSSISNIEFQSGTLVPTPTPTVLPTPSPTHEPTATPTPVIEEPTATPIPLVESTPSPTPSPEIQEPTPTPLPPIDVNNDAIWDSLAQCESGGNWGINTGNGYFGGLQFSQGAWNSVGGSGEPHNSSREEQISRGKLLQQKRGWGAWGACAKKLGLN